MGVNPPIFVLSEKKYEGALNLPLILFKYFTVSIDLSAYDALIFSSKNGVIAIDKITPKWKDLPIYSIGSGTSAEVLKRGARVKFEAKSSYGDAFAEEIKALLYGKKALFIRAKTVTSSLNVILKEAGVFLDEVVLYETVCAPCQSIQAPPHGAIIIFSSPSTIDCFFRCFSWDKSYQAVVIGEKTASFMPKKIPFTTAPEQSISSCIALSNLLSKNRL